MIDSTEVPADLYVALEWIAASGELPALRTLDADALAALCDQSAAEFRAAVEAEGGPVNDATVTAGTLAELAAWVRALSPEAYLEVARRARLGPPRRPPVSIPEIEICRWCRHEIRRCLRCPRAASNLREIGQI